MISRLENVRMQRMVAGLIEPARTIIQARFGIEDRFIALIIEYSPFVPEGQKPLLSLGFTRFFQGDFMSAAYLIVPQLEPCLRHVLIMNGHDPVKRRDDSTEEDLSLDGILKNFKIELESILGLTVLDEIDRLFNRRPGPALRHEFAHGQMSGGACFHPFVIYSLWFVYKICCLPLAKHWQSTLEPAIAEQQ